MAYARMMQRWVTLNGANVGSIAPVGYVVKQSSSGNFRVGEFRDLVAHVEVADFTGAPSLTFETGPTKNDEDFVAVDAAAAFALGVGVSNISLPYATVATPLGKYLRWKLTAGNAYGATFRIWLSVTS